MSHPWGSASILDNYINIAEKALEIVPNGFAGKNEALSYLNKAKKEAYDKEQARKNKIKKISVIVAALIIVAIAAGLLTTKVIMPNNHYNAAVELYENGSYDEAIHSNL